MQKPNAQFHIRADNAGIKIRQWAPQMIVIWQDKGALTTQSMENPVRECMRGIALFNKISNMHGTDSSAKNNSVRKEWFRQSVRGPSERSERSLWRFTPRPVWIPGAASHIALSSQFHRFFLLYQSLIGNDHSDIVATIDHTSGWVHWALAWLGISMRWGKLRKPLLSFVLPARTMQFSPY